MKYTIINVFILTIFFFIGFHFIITHKTSDLLKYEGFEQRNCPNLLIKKDNAYYMYNKHKAHIPGVNPIRFESLEEYSEFVEWLRSQGIACPILYLQQTLDAQGSESYRILPDPDEPNIGLPLQYPAPKQKLLDAGHNKGSMPGYDPMNMYIGLNTPLDKINHNTNNQMSSDNPMDANWGGVDYARHSVESGKYAENEVFEYKN